QRRGGAIQTLEDIAFPERVANAFLAAAAYLGKTFWPVSLAVLYPHPHLSLLDASVIASALLLGSITALALWTWNSARFFAFGWLWYLGTLVPVIGLIPV